MWNKQKKHFKGNNRRLLLSKSEKIFLNTTCTQTHTYTQTNQIVKGREDGNDIFDYLWIKNLCSWRDTIKQYFKKNYSVRKYICNTCFNKGFYPVYKRNSHESILSQITRRKRGKRFEHIHLKREYLDGSSKHMKWCSISTSLLLEKYKVKPQWNTKMPARIANFFKGQVLKRM